MHHYCDWIMLMVRLIWVRRRQSDWRTTVETVNCSTVSLIGCMKVIMSIVITMIMIVMTIILTIFHVSSGWLCDHDHGNCLEKEHLIKLLFLCWSDGGGWVREAQLRFMTRKKLKLLAALLICQMGLHLPSKKNLKNKFIYDQEESDLSNRTSPAILKKSEEKKS